jgi:hypothetical protein
MCDIETKETSPGEWQIVCKISGKQIDRSNKNGMYCEDMCDEKKDIAAGLIIEGMIDLLTGLDTRIVF